MIFTTAATRAQGFNGRPTSTVFKTEHDYSTDENDDYIAYCWHNVPGLQKFGKYTGNGDSDGSFIELGFRPALVLIKVTTTTNDWVIYDTERDTFNASDAELYPNTSGAENTSGPIDILSNGFKLRWSDTAINGSGTNYIYLAFGQSIVGSNNVPATAR